MFIQLKDTILQKISEGEYKGGDKLPSERELSEMYGISRVTVRQTLNELVKDGVLVKKQGKGNYVAIKVIDHKLDSLMGFVEEFAIKQMKCEVVVRKQEYVVAPPEVCAAMHIEQDFKMLMIIRQIYVDGKTLGIDYTYLPMNVAYLLEGLDFHNDIVYPVLEKNGYKITTADQAITAETPTLEEAALLNQKVTTPVLAIQRVTYVEGDRAIMFNRTVYLADRYRYTLTLKRYHTTF
ncbi:GntR family transcriptional regulator [Clostridium sp. KNHs216]|uniref:GntR family transcriptional regulator n=1 Tax=Eubacteriales TaxID=186802 RepID=UPI00056F334F|nr:GntR family transcriptional regulator [Clostridium sp. KNHs216]